MNTHHLTTIFWVKLLGTGRYRSFRLRIEPVGVQVKLWDPLRTRATPECFWGDDSRRGAISSVRTFTFGAIRGLMRGLPGNQEPLVVKDKAGRPQVSLGEQVNGMWHFFHSVLWHCWLGDRKGIQPVKSWVLVCWWWRFHLSFARLIAPVVTTTASIILSYSKFQNGDILVPA